jgi:peptide deformylase
MAREIRLFGDPVLKAPAAEITDVDGKIARLVDEMFEVMYEAPGIGLAAPQVGVQKQLFVYDNDGQTGVVINPTIKDSGGEWVYEEGCLSIPGLYVEIVRPKQVLLHGWDLDGNEVEFEADELWARLIQHELDHLHGVLMFDRMTPDQRKEALIEYRRIQDEPVKAPRRPRRLRCGGGRRKRQRRQGRGRRW